MNPLNNVSERIRDIISINTRSLGFLKQHYKVTFMLQNKQYHTIIKICGNSRVHNILFMTTSESNNEFLDQP